MALLHALKQRTSCPHAENLVMTTKAHIIGLPSCMSNSPFSRLCCKFKWHSVPAVTWHRVCKTGKVLAENTAVPVGVVNTALCSSACPCTLDGILGVLYPVEKNRPFAYQEWAVASTFSV